MRHLIFLLAFLLLDPLVAAQKDGDIKAAYEKVMELLRAPEGQTLDEAASKARATLFRQSLDGFITDWIPRRGEISEGRLLLGKALSMAGRPEEAIPHLKAFVEAHPDSEDVEDGLLALGSSYLDSRNSAQASEVFTRFLSERSESTRRHVAEFYLALARYQLGQVEAAVAGLDRVIATGLEDPFVADANLKAIEFLRDEGRAEEARKRLQPLVAEGSDASYLQALREQLDWIGKEAPELTAMDAWVGSGPVTVKGSAGRVLVLTFFADRYESSKSELQVLSSLFDRFAPRGVAFLALTKYYRPLDKVPAGEQKRLHEKLFAELGIKLPLGIAKDFSNLHAYGVRGIPYTVVIGKDGKIAHVKSGGSRRNQGALKALERAITRALEG